MRTVMALILATLIVGATAPRAVAQPSAEDVVVGMIEAINDRDFAALPTYVARDVKRHCSATPDVTVENLAQFEDFLHRDLAAFPDARQEVTHIFGSGNLVAVRAIYRGTQTGPLGPFPATGQWMEIPFIGILRVADGKVAEIWVEWDNLNGLMQLGLYPPSDEAPGAPGTPVRME